jgi:hypothetical protein
VVKTMGELPSAIFYNIVGIIQKFFTRDSTKREK